ncbi:MAG: aminoacetone oxidase family FAD-binding enzyme [bacterium]
MIPQKAQKASVVVIGAGPAGLAAAMSAAGCGADVLVFEQLTVAGRRLLATGGGHCNFTNILAADEFSKRFGPAARFVSPAFKAMDSASLRDYFTGIGVPSHVIDGFHVYPVSNSAVAVRDSMVRECGRLGIRFRLGARVAGLVLADGRVIGVEAGGVVVNAVAVVLAAGGASRGELGGGTGGANLARAAGHAIREPVPALVPLITREDWPRELAGVTVPAVIAKFDGGAGGPGAIGAGALLFTHRGISGPAVLDVSGSVASALRKTPQARISLDLAPDMSADDWRLVFDKAKQEQGARGVFTVLRGHFPAVLAKIMVGVAGLPDDLVVSRMSTGQRHAVVGCIKAMTLDITGTEGMSHAMASRGGVALEQIDRKTFESKITRGLFVAGEVMDVDGPCGGFNLHWAFASGYVAGKYAGQTG